MPPWIMSRAPVYACIAALVVTYATHIPGLAHTVHGAHRWIRIGSITAQPGEILKICTLWYLSYMIDKKRFTMYDIYHTCIPMVCIIGLACFALLIQPDFGQAVTLGVTCGTMLYLFGMPLSYLCSIGILSIIAVIALIMHAPYRLYRIMSFLNPWDDPHGRGFQVIQSLIAIGSGGWTGQGITYSQQKYFYLPMHHTDFIYAIIAEETGFIGACCVIAIYAIFLCSGYALSRHFTARIAESFTCGYTTLVTIQALANISVTLGILPPKGLGLPFISYGVSTLIAHGIACGIIGHYWRTRIHTKEHICLKAP